MRLPVHYGAPSVTSRFPLIIALAGGSEEDEEDEEAAVVPTADAAVRALMIASSACGSFEPCLLDLRR